MIDLTLAPVAILMLLVSHAFAIMIGMRVQDGRITLMNLAFHIAAMACLMATSVYLLRQL